MPSRFYTWLILEASRLLGTPNDDIWPGVKALPDYKTSFPQWHPIDLAKAVPGLDEYGLDLLKVGRPSNSHFACVAR